MASTHWTSNAVLDEVLDTRHPPVARFRIVSGGLSAANTLPEGDSLAGVSACLACGNCVDACPVVASKPSEAVVARTSMALETIVGEECRRCYKCVAACPQIDRPIRDYVRGFRRVERIVHWMLLSSLVFLAASGITIYHYHEWMLPELYLPWLGFIHRVAALFFIAAPLVYLIGDRRHLHRTFHGVITWGSEDREWLRNFLRWLISFGREGRLMRGDMNTAQKCWYVFLAFAITVLSVTGLIKWGGAGWLSEGALSNVSLMHDNVALLGDILVAFHVYLKLIYPYGRDAVRGIAATVALSRFRAGIAPARDPR